MRFVTPSGMTAMADFTESWHALSTLCILLQPGMKRPAIRPPAVDCLEQVFYNLPCPFSITGSGGCALTDHSRHENPRGLPPFSPLFDDVAHDLGRSAASVYGAVWRHCQLRDGVCRASIRTLSTKLGCHMSTVQRQLRRLVSAGYLIDTTPGARNRPHVYRVLSWRPQPPAAGDEREA
jgi:hypothetical protein